MRSVIQSSLKHVGVEWGGEARRSHQLCLFCSPEGGLIPTSCFPPHADQLRVHTHTHGRRRQPDTHSQTRSRRRQEATQHTHTHAHWREPHQLWEATQPELTFILFYFPSDFISGVIASFRCALLTSAAAPLFLKRPSFSPKTAVGEEPEPERKRERKKRKHALHRRLAAEAWNIS